MTAQYPQPPAYICEALAEGLVIPAHPLALTHKRRLDIRRQRALTRYYHAAGAGGIAVGVHTTQFEIRQPQFQLLEPVLSLAAETITACDAATGRQTVRIAGVVGETKQARAEAALARELGYHIGLLSLAALKEAGDDTLMAHCQTVAREIPLMGFYLQPAAGGRILPYSFWRRFVETPNVVAVKIAPFNRYQTLDVIRAVAESGRAGEIALYTGNDDNIIPDLVTRYRVPISTGIATLCFAGGLLGHWACWTREAVNLLQRCKEVKTATHIPADLLALAGQVTDANGAIFDAPHNFAGCIAGIHEVLRRQGLLENLVTLNPRERLSPGQAEEIDRVWQAYPHLSDDAFVQENLESWLK
ncbi:MAG: dihydrodipicolinate synthase family protein [Anaerolineales bacterium]|nr:MAG: dihydrodipicolinate synthase family protein [Anaerolineales bacterium]